MLACGVIGEGREEEGGEEGGEETGIGDTPGLRTADEMSAGMRWEVFPNVTAPMVAGGEAEGREVEEGGEEAGGGREEEGDGSSDTSHAAVTACASVGEKGTPSIVEERRAARDRTNSPKRDGVPRGSRLPT